MVSLNLSLVFLMYYYQQKVHFLAKNKMEEFNMWTSFVKKMMYVEMIVGAIALLYIAIQAEEAGWLIFFGGLLMIAISVIGIMVMVEISENVLECRQQLHSLNGESATACYSSLSQVAEEMKNDNSTTWRCHNCDEKNSASVRICKCCGGNK